MKSSSEVRREDGPSGHSMWAWMIPLAIALIASGIAAGAYVVGHLRSQMGLWFLALPAVTAVVLVYLSFASLPNEQLDIGPDALVLPHRGGLARRRRATVSRHEISAAKLVMVFETGARLLLLVDRTGKRVYLSSTSVRPVEFDAVLRRVESWLADGRIQVATLSKKEVLLVMREVGTLL